MVEQTLTIWERIALVLFCAGFITILAFGSLWPVSGETTLVVFRSKAAMVHAPARLAARSGRILRIDTRRKTALVRFDQSPPPFGLFGAGIIIAVRASGVRGCAPTAI